MHTLFTAPVLQTEQPPRLPAAKSRYTVRDGQGTVLAEAAEEDVPIRKQISRVVFGGIGVYPRTVQVRDPQGTPVLVIANRGYDTDTSVLLPDGRLIGWFRQNRYAFRYSLLDAAGNAVGELKGNRLGRRFQVLDGYGQHVAQVDKKWAGLGKEVLTTADRYTTEVRAPLPEPLRTLVVTAAIAVDMMHYEEKDFTP
ncbi:hypothetical protein GCM10009678_94110 [Actinomadura kijaniata]|uniref:Uncharacterized protein YxjI n=1 Tax=Actinomadura namibiensis TaxID=182080 RepID=A0A7W3QQI0_ACTNM|nr:phospholipid scramblase-related protein [Actinomadura namibiensis]MBA8955724.1 uncharacterized protein YxjI [Actinomadura namibiensis]